MRWDSTSFYRTFGCPIICTDTYSQCYCGHWHIQQCLTQSSSLVSRDAIFSDKASNVAQQECIQMTATRCLWSGMSLWPSVCVSQVWGCAFGSGGVHLNSSHTHPTHHTHTKTHVDRQTLVKQCGLILKFYEPFEFPDVYFNLTSGGLNLTPKTFNFTFHGFCSTSH